MSITIPEWMYKDLGLGRTDNKSEKIQELIMKGYMAEKLKHTIGQKENGVYRQNNRVYANNLFGASSETLSRQFNAFVRPKLSGAWQERVAVCQRNGIHEFVLQPGR